MNDAIALLAISQLVCIGGISYLYLQLQGMRRDHPQRRPRRGPEADTPQREPIAARTRAAASAYAAPERPARAADLFARDAGSIAARLGELGADVPALARRMGKSEEEVRLLLRRRGMSS